MQAIVEQNKEIIKKLCEEYQIKNLYAFGSAVAGNFTDKSDIDLLYEMDHGDLDFNDLDQDPYNPFIVYFDLKEKLEALFDREVDLVPDHDKIYA